MKHLLLTLAALSALFSHAVFASCPDFLNHSMRKLASTEEVQFCEAYEGKALLIVNTASYCGYTSQFESLEKVHRAYADNGLVVLGFSSDDFFQEDNDEGDAAEVCFENGDDFVIWLAGLEVSGMFGGYLQGFSKSLVRPDFLVFEPPSILQATLIKGRDP